MMLQGNIKRLRVLSVCIIGVALIFFVKLYMLQVIHHEDFVNLADKQYVKKTGGVFSRGTIYFEDKNGELVSAATLKTGYILAINPTLIKDKNDVYEKLSKIIEIDKEDFMARASKSTDPYEEVAKRIPEKESLEIQALKLSGVYLYKEQWRFYPGGKTASNVLGFLGYKGDEYGGRYGLENFYEKVLERNGGDIYANFFVEIFSNIEKTISKDGSFEGDIIATIEPSVETTLEDTLAKIQSKWSSAETGGIIMNPKTGEIYAMASVPTFNPNDFSQEKDVSVFSNPLVDNVREMGSIIKPLTIASGIDAGVITPQTTYDDKGFVKANTETIWNHDKKAHGITTMQEVLNNSLNAGVAFVEKKLGNKKFADYMFGYGLNTKTGIDLPNEASNIINNLSSPRDIEYITASFGQGIALTAISTIRALSVLANGGTLVTPHVVKKINYKGGFFKNTDISAGPQIIKKETSEAISRMLVEVVDTALIQGKGKNEHYTIGAKTGTAQMAKPNGGGYYNDRYLHSFFGYFPAYDPKFIVFLYTLDPKVGDLFAADTLAMPFFDLSKFLINYYEIAPDR
jgi:stage V sporulation protein D (sporulation-specific penicillin-binding protein)